MKQIIEKIDDLIIEIIAKLNDSYAEDEEIENLQWVLSQLIEIKVDVRKDK